MSENNAIENTIAERGLLGSLMVNIGGTYEVLQKINFVRKEHFYEPVHQRIFSAILEFAEKGLNATPVTLRNYFEKDNALFEVGGSEYLAKIASSAAVINLKSYAIEVVEAYTRRRLAELAYWLGNAARDYQDAKGSQEILNSASRILEEITHQNTSHPILTSKEVGYNIVDGFKQKLRCYDVGIPRLSEAMGGGLYEGKAYGMAARKKVGKTIMASTISYNLNKAGVKHLFIAAEMSPAEIQQRNIARGIKRNSVSFISSDREDFEFQSNVGKFADADEGNIHYLHIPGISFDELKRNIALAVYKYKIKGFILDYFQLVRCSDARQNKVEFFDEVAQWIADYCRQEKIWALVTAQINQQDNIRWGEGMRLAFDQVYHLQKSETQEGMYFIEMMDTRYTPWIEIGNKDHPIIRIEKTGPYFSEEM